MLFVNHLPSGTVKDDDVRRYPPFGILEPEMRYNHLGQRMLPRRLGDTGGSAGNRRNQFSNRAKAGFQYWYKEPTSNISRELYHQLPIKIFYKVILFELDIRTHATI